MVDFFQAQAQAHKRTKWLIALVIPTVAAIITALYLLIALLLVHYKIKLPHNKPAHFTSYEQYLAQKAAPPPLWDPWLLATVSGATLLIVGGAAIRKTSELSSGGSAVAEMVGGRRIDSQTTDLKERRLLNVVEEMAIASGIPMPAVYLLEKETCLNAFAAGYTTNDAVVAVTRGTLDKLTRDELQGVVAHEFSHILNGDMRLNIRLLSLLFGIFFLTIIGIRILSFLRHFNFARKRSRGAAALVFICGLALIIIGSIGYFFGRLIQAAISRQREFLADASAVQFTRNPGGISGALKKIGGFPRGSRVANADATAAGHFFFASALRSSFRNLLETHPPLDQRIRTIDPKFDGRYIEPDDTIVPARERTAIAKTLPPALALHVVPPTAAINFVASIGTLTPEQVANAQTILAQIPERLQEAARHAGEAPSLIFGLLLDVRAEIRAKQLARMPRISVQTLDALAEPLAALKPEHKLPLCQLALPSLRALEATVLSEFFAITKELIEADSHVSIFEFTLKKLLHRQIVLGQTPRNAPGPGSQLQSFEAVRSEIVIVFSAMAHASTADPHAARGAFDRGARQLKVLEGTLEPLAPTVCALTHLDKALDRLVLAAGPIKQRVLLACAQIVSADDQLLIGEAELMRAVSALLDCPVPPIASAAPAA